jgi:DNA processing protein
VFAVPGSPFDIRCSGTNALIKNGAVLIENAEDVINELQNTPIQLSFSDLNNDFYQSSKKKIPSEVDLARHRESIIRLIPYNAIRIEDLIHCLEVEPEIVNFLILELELAGKAMRVYNNSVMRLP